MAKPSKARKQLEKRIAAARAEQERLQAQGAGDEDLLYALGVYDGLREALEVIE